VDRPGCLTAMGLAQVPSRDTINDIIQDGRDASRDTGSTGAESDEYT